MISLLAYGEQSCDLCKFEHTSTGSCDEDNRVGGHVELLWVSEVLCVVELKEHRYSSFNGSSHVVEVVEVVAQHIINEAQGHTN